MTKVSYFVNKICCSFKFLHLFKKFGSIASPLCKSESTTGLRAVAEGIGLFFWSCAYRGDSREICCDQSIPLITIFWLNTILNGWSFCFCVFLTLRSYCQIFLHSVFFFRLRLEWVWVCSKLTTSHCQRCEKKF
jgi:hypothetical protein